MKKLKALCACIVALPLLLLFVIVAYFTALYCSLTNTEEAMGVCEKMADIIMTVLDWGWDNS
jgi:hypothetical protein